MGQLIDKASGKIKQAVGTLTNDQALKREGQVEELKGDVKAKLDDIKDAAGHVKSAVKKLTR